MTSELKKTKFCGIDKFTTTPPDGFTKEQCGEHMMNFCNNNFNNQNCISYFSNTGTPDYTQNLEKYCSRITDPNNLSADMKNACACHYPQKVYENYMLKQIEGVKNPDVIASIKSFNTSAPSCKFPDCGRNTAIPQWRRPVQCPNVNIQNCINTFNAEIGDLKGNIRSSAVNNCIQGSNVTVNQGGGGKSLSEEKDESVASKSFILLILAIFAALWTIILGLVFKNMIVIVISGFVTLSLLLGSFLVKSKTVVDTKTTGTKKIQTAKATGPPVVTLLKNEKSNMCLDVTDVEAYGKLIDTPCKNLPSQKYLIEPDIQRISINSSPNLCIDDIISTKPFEQKLQIYDNIPGSGNQTFVYKKETKHIENTSKNLCISRGEDGYYYLDVCKDVTEQKFDLI